MNPKNVYMYVVPVNAWNYKMSSLSWGDCTKITTVGEIY